MRGRMREKKSLEAFLKDCMERAAANPRPFHVVVFNKVPTNRHAPGAIHIEVKRRTDFEKLKSVLCLFAKGGMTEETFYKRYEVVDLSKKELSK